MLIERGARKQPYMVAATHDIEEARRLLAGAPNQELARELAWSAAGHGCPAIVAMALSHLDWQPNDPRWHWVLIQPIRDAGEDPSQNEGHFRSRRYYSSTGWMLTFIAAMKPCCTLLQPAKATSQEKTGRGLPPC